MKTNLKIVIAYLF